jgi:signal transduction histidine kinase
VTPNRNQGVAVLLISLATGGYVLLFVFLYPLLGSPLIALSLVPVMLSGWLWGLRAGVIAGISAALLHAVLFYLVVPQWEAVWLRGGVGHLALTFIGGVIGWLSRLLQQVRHQSELLISERKALEEQIAERRLAERALQTAKEEAEAANRSKSDFTSMITHELNTPMSQIMGYAELLLDDSAESTGENQRRHLRTILANVERMIALVNDLAEISQIESGNLRLNCEALSLTEVLDEVVLSSYRQIADKKQTLLVETAPELPPVLADRRRLGQVLTNLVSNAQKYTPPGGRITIAATFTAALEAVHIRVQDTGIGIKPEDQARIFEKFFRAEDPELRRTAGTGLGLAIVKLLVEEQGGRIWCESEFRQGTAFHLTLPVAPLTAVPQARHTTT